MRGDSAFVGHYCTGYLHERDKIWVGHVCYEYVAFLHGIGCFLGGENNLCYANTIRSLASREPFHNNLKLFFRSFFFNLGGFFHGFAAPNCFWTRLDYEYVFWKR